ncbi:MAG: DUF3105 domain-containing protein [Candidatus Wildermuthbacteria bacterium]|nr:DUF3105 domain-containing protein [Candidatus Wildermuthbacteria bacterium]
MEQEISPAQPLTRKERRELKRAEKQEKRSQEKSKRGVKKIMLWGVGLLLVAGVITSFFIFSSKTQTSQPDFSKAVADEGRTHISEGIDAEHQSNPPTSGDHWPVPLSDGIYSTEKPDEAIIHNLEHGRVWVSYKPSIPEQTKKTLEDLMKRYNGTVLTPRSANDTDIALAAWNRLDTFNLEPNGTFNEQRVIDFINRWRNKGPEFVPGNGGGKTYE